MKNAKNLLVMLLMACTSNLYAQQINASYFLDGFAYGHEMNPAKDYDGSGYFSLPFIPSNVNYSNQGTLGLKDIFYKNPAGSGLITYLHPSLTAEETIGRLNETNKLQSDIRYDIFSFGFHTKKTYQNITIGLRTNLNMSVPYEFFDLTKNMEKRSYSINGLDVRSKAWLEAGWGYSREVAHILRVGFKLKGLLGVGTAKAALNNLELDYDNYLWNVKADASAEVALRGFTWGEKKNLRYSDAYLAAHPDSPEEYEAVNLDHMKFKGPNLSSYGMAFDLGVEADLGKIGIAPGLKLSAAVLDLGFINWKDISQATSVQDEFQYNGFQDITAEDEKKYEFRDLSDCISNLLSLEEHSIANRRETLASTINVGARYTMPFFSGLSIGLLSTLHFQGDDSWNEARASINLRLGKWVEIAANTGIGTFGKSVGWTLNLRGNGISFFAGGEHNLSDNAKKAIILGKATNLAAGINFPIRK